MISAGEGRGIRSVRAHPGTHDSSAVKGPPEVFCTQRARPFTPALASHQMQATARCLRRVLGQLLQPLTAGYSLRAMGQQVFPWRAVRAMCHMSPGSKALGVAVGVAKEPPRVQTADQLCLVRNWGPQGPFPVRMRR